MKTLTSLFLLSFLICLLVTPLVRALATLAGLVDKPDGRRKFHFRTTPVGGGIAVFIATSVSLSILLLSGLCPWEFDFRDYASQWFGLAAGCVVVCIVGVLDDLRLLKRHNKFLGQTVAVLIVVLSGLVVRNIQIAGLDIELDYFAIPFTAFFLLGAVNSLNLLDGMDGLLSTVGLIVCTAFVAMAVMGNKWATACVAVAMAGALLAFLRYNFPPASIYLGDTGSMLVGLVIGSLAIHSSLKGPATLALAAPLAILVVPILDTLAAILRRKLTGRSLYDTDRGHLHHCLLRLGFSKAKVLLCISAFCLLACLGVLLSVRLHAEWIALLGAAIVALMLVQLRWFGHGEVQLVSDRLKESLDIVMGRVLRSNSPRNSAILLQGSDVWTAKWEGLTKFANEAQFKMLRLDINASAIHESYHGRWVNPVQGTTDNPSHVWNVAFPLIWNGQTVGRMEASALRDGQPVWTKFAELNKLVDDLESTIQELSVENAAQTPTRVKPRRKVVPLDLPNPAMGAASAMDTPKPAGDRLRVLVLNRSYYPDVEATGQLLTELCTDLARDHDVHVIAGLPNFVGVGGKGLIRHDQHEGVEVTRVRNVRFSKKSLLGRGIGLVSYLALAFWAGLRAKKADVILVETDPPFLGFIGVLLSRWHQCPFVYYLQDLYPEVGLALGKMKPGLITKILHWTTQYAMNGADRIIVLGEDMRAKVLHRGIEADKIAVVPNWADTDLIRPRPRPPITSNLDAEDPLIVMYSGNVGLSQNLDHLLEAARDLRDSPVKFVIIGEGAAKSGLMAKAGEWNLTNVSFHSYRAKDELCESLTSADVHFVPLRRGLAGSIVPSKLYGILAAGVPFIAAVETSSEVAKVAKSTGAGIVVSPDCSGELTEALGWCLMNRNLLAGMGEQGRVAAVSRFSRPICVQKIDTLISDVAELDDSEWGSPPGVLAGAKS